LIAPRFDLRGWSPVIHILTTRLHCNDCQRLLKFHEKGRPQCAGDERCDTPVQRGRTGAPAVARKPLRIGHDGQDRGFSLTQCQGPKGTTRRFGPFRCDTEIKGGAVEGTTYATVAAAVGIDAGPVATGGEGPSAVVLFDGIDVPAALAQPRRV